MVGMDTGDVTLFETIVPSRFLILTIPDAFRSGDFLRVAILDSPNQPGPSPQVAVLLVPQNRESDWVFSSETGHLQLLLSYPGLSRLILVGKTPRNFSDSPLRYAKEETQYVDDIKLALHPLFSALSPKVCLQSMDFNPPFLEYEDDVVRGMVLEICIGSSVGEFLVEDVEIDGPDSREFRRRMRFKRMPNLVQTEIKIVPETLSNSDSFEIGKDAKFRPNIEVVVSPYLIAMVAGVSLINCDSVKPKVLCLGIGGGALLSFLKTQFGADVLGVEIDENVLKIARKYFGFDDSVIDVHVGDAVEFVKMISKDGDSFMLNKRSFIAKFDVIMVDLDSNDARDGISAPPLQFIEKSVLSAAKSILCDYGLLVVNTLFPNRSSYDAWICELFKCFPEVYEIDVGNGENLVVIAKLSRLSGSSPVSVAATTNRENDFLQKLRASISGKYMDSIKKL